MDRNLQDVTDAELAVLQTLWDRGPSTIRRLTDDLYPDGTEVHYATVQKLLERLEGKGHVTRDRSAHAHRFTARTNRDVLVGSRLRAMAEKLCGGLMGPLLTHLVRAEALSAQERQELRALIDEMDQPKASPDKPRKGRR
jgi:predicted transcriptional regulator